jgi:hypothetical protein
VGPFGTGKSHTLSVIRQIAQAEGYLAIHAELDGAAVSLADPSELLFSLMRTLQLQEDTVVPIVELSKRASGRGHQQALLRLVPFPKVQDNYGTVVALKDLGQLDALEEHLDLLMAGGNAYTAAQLKAAICRELEPEQRKGVNPSRLVSMRVDERPADFARAIGGYARLAERAGFKGLVLTLDEFEVEQSIYRLMETIDGLVTALFLQPTPKSAPLTLFVGVVPSAGADGNVILDRVIDNAGGDQKVLKPWSGHHLKLLARKVYATYSQAYELDEPFDDSIVDETREDIQSADEDLEGHVRTFLKRYVAKLDSLQGPPAKMS